MKGEAVVIAGSRKMRVVFDVRGKVATRCRPRSMTRRSRGRQSHLPAGTGRMARVCSKELGFRVRFPGQPTTKSGTTARGRPTTEVDLQVDRGRVYYRVDVTEYPADVKLDPATIYAN